MRQDNIPTLESVRKMYPYYQNANDEDLANALYKKYGNAQDRNEFNTKIGYREPSLTEKAVSAVQKTGEGMTTSVHTLANLMRSGLLGFGGSGANLANLLTRSKAFPTEQEQASALGWNLPTGTPGKIAEAAGSIPFYALGTETGAPLFSALKASPKLASLLSLIGTSGAMGAAGSPHHRLLGMAEGLGAGTAGAVLPEVGKLAVGGLLNKMNPELQKSIFHMISSSDAPDEINAQTFKHVSKNYKNAALQQDTAWDQLLKEAKRKGKDNFDDEKYKQWLEDLHDKIITDARGQTHLEEQIAPTVSELQKLHSSPVDNMEDAVAHRKAINTILASKSKMGPNALSDTSIKFLQKVINSGTKDYKGVKSKFDESILENLGDMKGTDRLARAWKKANDSTQMLKKFELTRGLSGKPVSSKFYTMYRYGASPDEASRFLEPYSDIKGGGISQFNTLGEMLGSKEHAAYVLRHNLFSPVGEKEELSMKKFADRYNKLSTSQKGFLFNKGQQAHIQDVMKFSEKYPEKKQNLSKLGYFAALHTPGGLLGLYLGNKAAHKMGIPPWLGGVGGAALGISSVEGIDKLVSDIVAKTPALKKSLFESAIKNLGPKPKLSSAKISRRALIPASLLDHLRDNNGST